MSVKIPNFAPQGAKKQNKYHNVKVQIDGHTFDSKAEAARYQELKLMQRAGAIREFSLQPNFALEAGIHYRADFLVTGKDGTVWAEDVKGFETKEFKLKKKLFEWKYPQIELRLIK